MDYQETIFTAKKENSSIILPYFICGSFNVAVSSSNYADQMGGTLEGLAKEAIKVKMKVLPVHAMKACRGSRDIPPFILKLSAG